ncbi:HD domain-containing protein [Thalassobellus citreus]|uniref:HD domain-containing protein n=1 Tax=Thalassobellus citreus TaxID=3367752 RepID=UPI0037ABDDE6
MSNLESKLKELNANLSSSFEETKNIVSKLLQQYIKNFPTYTDHSIEHTQEVLNIAGNLLTDVELDNLNADEIYILCMACILHDVGMCIPENKIKEISETKELIDYRKFNPDFSTEKYIRDIHHVLSLKFINEEWKLLNIPTEKYAEAIGLVAQGHRKVDLNDFELYDPQFFVKSGREFVCLPYLSCILRIADELDITNLRTPDILLKYYIPDNKISEKEWNKHKSTIQVNFKSNKVIIQAKCTDHNILSALEEQFEKIKNVINDCQKIIRSLSLVDRKIYNLNINSLQPKYIYENFDPKGIKYSFEFKNVVKTFIGEELYKNNKAALREVVQNAIDACNYKKSIKKEAYNPKVIIYVCDDFISIEDNGQGMDEFIIENYFGKLASSFYQQDSIKNDYEAIGQFGVGVFSYFLLSDYIDVETKRAEKPSLKFRTDKDPNGYFHFFDDFHRDEEGTKIILHLKEKHKTKISLREVIDFVEKTFPFVKIPIIVRDETEEINISMNEMSISYEKDILPHFYFNSRKYSDLYKVISVYENNDKYEGVLAIIVPNSLEEESKDLYYIIDSSSLEEKEGFANDTSLISFSQKGVHINNYEGRLNFTFGKINIKQKLKVNLSRTDFVDDNATEKTLEGIEAKLINEVFNEIITVLGTNNINHKKQTDWFIKNYWQGYYYSIQVAKIIKELFCFEFNYKNSIEYYTLNEYVKLFSKIVVFQSEKDAENYSSFIDCPYVILDITSGDYYNYSRLFSVYIDFGYSVVKIKDRYFKCFDKSSYEHLSKVESIFSMYNIQIELSNIESKAVGVNYLENSDLVNKDKGFDFSYRDSVSINVNHWLISNLVQFSKKNRFNSTDLRLINELFGILDSYYRKLGKKPGLLKETIKSCNSIISKIHEGGRIKLNEFTKKDLQH